MRCQSLPINNEDNVNMNRSVKTGIGLAAALLTTAAGAAQLPSPEVMWDIIQKQQKEQLTCPVKIVN